MAENDQDKPTHRLAGYAALIDRYDLDVIPNCHRSFITTSGVHRIHSTGGAIEEVYSPPYWPGDTLGDHLEFALKYDGTNLAVLASLFPEVAEEDLLEYIRSKPTGKYARRLWFLYEFLTGRTLPLDDVKWGNYVDVLESDEYYTVTPARQVRRQRINDNLLGGRLFCPTVRRTDTLRDFETADLPRRCRQVVSDYSPELLKRALGYLYTEEMKSSFEIEHINPTSTRTERFVTLLQLAEQEDFCEKTQLIELQNRVVDSRFREADYRLGQSYVGETIAWQKEKIHFACPKPEDLPNLMEGLVIAHKRMDTGNVSAVIHAAANAIMKTFIERSAWRLWRPASNVTRYVGWQESRIKDKQRYLVTVTTSGGIPSFMRYMINGSTREMSGLARHNMHARVVGRIYSGMLFHRGLRDREKKKARNMGRALVEAIEAD